ncbi:MAG: alpha/beta hydrolase [Acidobacteriota bacterium]
MPLITLKHSPLARRENPQLFYRETGEGLPLLFMHGGWGYGIYPFDKQIDALKNDYRILIPDRSGYGRSERIARMDWDFHRHAAEEMINFLDAQGIEKTFLWGHSDGSVIAVWMSLLQPERFYGIIFEAFHYYRVKPASRGFFETMMHDPMQLGERVVEVLQNEHGADYWLQLIEMNGNAWVEIADRAEHEKHDLYDGRLSEISNRALFIHGKQDPRTEADELAQVAKQLPHIPIRLIEDGKHSPHSERAAADETIQIAARFFQETLA